MLIFFKYLIMKRIYAYIQAFKNLTFWFYLIINKY